MNNAKVAPAPDVGEPPVELAASLSPTATEVRTTKSGDVEKRLAKDIELGSVHDLYHELRLEAQAAGIELQSGEESSKLDVEAILKNSIDDLLDKILPKARSKGTCLTASSIAIKTTKAQVKKKVVVLAEALKKKIKKVVVAVGKLAMKDSEEDPAGKNKKIKARLEAQLKDFLAKDEDWKTFEYDVKAAVKELNVQLKELTKLDASTIEDVSSVDMIDAEFQETLNELIATLTDQATKIAEAIQHIGGNFSSLLSTFAGPVFNITGKGDLDILRKIKEGITAVQNGITAVQNVSASADDIDKKVTELTQRLEDKARAFLAKLAEQIKDEVKLLAGEIAKHAVSNFFKHGSEEEADPLSTVMKKITKDALDESLKRIKKSVKAFVDEATTMMMNEVPDTDNWNKDAGDGTHLPTASSSFRKQLRLMHEKKEEEIQVQAKKWLTKAAEKLGDAVGRSGLSDSVQNAVDAAQDTVDLLLSEASGVVEDITGNGAFLQTFLNFIGPFLVKGASSLVTQKRKNPLAYDAIRGYKLFEDFPSWYRHMLLYRNLSGKRALAAVFLFFMFLMQMWFLAVYSFFIPYSNIDINVEADTHRLPGGINGTLTIEPQVDRWNEDNILMKNCFYFLAFFVAPIINLTSGKMLIDVAQLPLCGSMVTTLEKHYGGKIREHVDLKANLGDPIRNRSWWLFVLAILGSVALAAGYSFNVSYNNRAWSGIMGGYLIAHLVCWDIAAVLLVFTMFGAWNVILTANVLFNHNILAYRELVDLVSMQVMVQLKKERAKLPKTRTAEEDTLAMNETCNNPLIKTLNAKLEKRERYLLAASNELLNGDIGTATNTIYALIVTGSFFFIFYVLIIVLEMTNTPEVVFTPGSTASAEFDYERSRQFTTVGGAFLGFPIVAFFFVWPILGMAAHPQEWGKLVNSLRTTNRKEVSRTLSNSDDPLMWVKHHESLAKNFAWKLLGQEISYKAIGTTIAGYVAILSSVVLVPALNKFTKDLQLQAGVNSSRSEL